MYHNSARFKFQMDFRVKGDFRITLKPAGGDSESTGLGNLSESADSDSPESAGESDAEATDPSL